MTLRVPPNATIPNIDQFDAVLVIPSESKIGIWTPVEWCRLGANIKTVKIVNLADTNELTLIDTYYSPPTSLNQILISATPLNYKQTISVIETLTHRDGSFSRVYRTLESYDLLAFNNQSYYTSSLTELTDHLHRVTISWCQRDPIESIPETQSVFERQTNNLRTLASGPLPTINAKLEMAQGIFNILVRHDKQQANDFLWTCIKSAELCPLIHIVDQLKAELGGLVPNALVETEEYIYTCKTEAEMIVRYERNQIRSGLQLLAYTEYYQVLNPSSVINGNEWFILSNQIQSLQLVNDQQLQDQMKTYLGFDPRLLDVNAGYLTGMIIAFCQSDPLLYYYYPSTFTVPRDLDTWRNTWLSVAKRPTSDRTRVKLINHNDKMVKILVDNVELVLDVVPGYSADIAVEDQNNLFDVAKAQHQSLKLIFPTAKLMRVNDSTYLITQLPRTIKIYTATIKDILHSTVPMIRGWISSNNDDDKMILYVSASCRRTMDNLVADYYYNKDIDTINDILNWQNLGWDFGQLGEVLTLSKKCNPDLRTFDTRVFDGFGQFNVFDIIEFDD